MMGPVPPNTQHRTTGDPSTERGVQFDFDTFESAAALVSNRLAFFRTDDFDAEPTENEKLLAGHLVGGLYANGFITKAARASPDPVEGAEQVVAALDAAGYVILPKEPTEAMIAAADAERRRVNEAFPGTDGCSPDEPSGEDYYRAMLAAAQKGEG